MKLNHTQFQKKVTKLLKSKGCWILNVHGHKMQKSGVPDFLVISRKFNGFIEIKIGKDTCSPIQKAVIKKLKERDFLVYVLRYDEDHDAIQIEDEDGIILSLVGWEPLWEWLKKPIHDMFMCHKNYLRLRKKV